MVCVPATAIALAEDNVSTFVSELDPVLYAIVPLKSVRFCKSVDSVDNCVPRLVSVESFVVSAVNWVFHGVSTACRLVTIWFTVVVTSTPSPLVAEPKFKPTVPMRFLPSRSRSDQHPTDNAEN